MLGQHEIMLGQHVILREALRATGLGLGREENPLYDSLIFLPFPPSPTQEKPPKNPTKSHLKSSLQESQGPTKKERKRRSTDYNKESDQSSAPTEATTSQNQQQQQEPPSSSREKKNKKQREYINWVNLKPIPHSISYLCILHFHSVHILTLTESPQTLLSLICAITASFS